MPEVSKQRVAIVVVAYNAESTLIATLDRIPEHVRPLVSELFIMDDASADRTHELARAWAAANTDFTTVVISHGKNLGYGGNQKAAYRVALERSIDVVVLLHADGQYAPELLGDVIAPILDGSADAVLGSRMMVRGAARRGGMPAYKRVGNRILTRLENRLLGTNLSEFHSGYRAYRVSLLDRLLVQENSDGFDFDTQVIAQIVHAGGRITEIPIPSYYGDEICYVNGMRYAWDVMHDVVRFRLALLGLGSPTWVPDDIEYDLKHAPASSHRLLASALVDRPRGRVLDVGCSGGQLSALLLEQGHHVTGVDAVEVPGVRDRVVEFHLADVAALPERLSDRRYEYIVAADVIEHLAEPLAVLRQLSGMLAEDGQLLLSVPNIGHWYPRLRVAFGVFGYDRRGILDRTHLRFFTRAGLRRLVASAGFDVLEEWHTGNPTEKLRGDGRGTGRRGRVGAWAGALLRELRPELFGYQNVLRCTPHAGSSTTTVFASVSVPAVPAPLSEWGAQSA